MKPYGTNNKSKKYYNNARNTSLCGCWLCIPVKKSTKSSERSKTKSKLKKDLKDFNN